MTIKYFPGSSGGSGSSVVTKSADETVSNSTTLQADDELTVPIAANETLSIEFIVFYNSSTSADINFGLAVPAGANFTYGVNGPALSATSGIADGVYSALIDNEWVSVGGTGNNAWAVVRAIVINGGTAGSVTLEWCQRIAEVSNTTVKARSHAIATRL